MFNEIKRPARLQKRQGGPSWKERHPKLVPALKRTAKTSYVIGGTHLYVRNNHTPVGLAVRGSILASPFMAGATIKRVKKRRAKKRS